MNGGGFSVIGSSWNIGNNIKEKGSGKTKRKENKGRITNDKTIVVVFSLPLPASIDSFCLLMGEFNYVERVDRDPPYPLRYGA